MPIYIGGNAPAHWALGNVLYKAPASAHCPGERLSNTVSLPDLCIGVLLSV